MQRHICFYSNKDSWSKAFIEELAKTPWVKEFRFVCVDPSPNRPALPSWLKQVPTLVIHGEQEPLTDNAVMNWLYERKMQESPSQSVKGPVEPEAWIDNEMSGFGNAGYSFTNTFDQGVESNAGQSIPGSFSFLNGGSSPGDRQSQHAIQSSGSSNQGRTKKEVQFDKQMEVYKQQREVGMPQQRRPI